MNPNHIMIVAGEASGDIHAAHLVDEIKKLAPSLTFSGLGGEEMRKSGVTLYEDFTKFAVVGFIEVLKHYKEFKRAFDAFLEKADEIKPAAVILVDYPGFNLRLAKELKKRGLKVIYYISPQVWAWKEKRVELIKQCVDKMIVLFPFEKDFYAKHNYDVDVVGHPLVDQIKVNVPRDQVLNILRLDEKVLTIGLLPGSRTKEIESMPPLMLSAARLMEKKHAKIQFILIKAPTIPLSQVEKYTKGFSVPVKIIEDNRFDAMNACDACLVTSGTATLETAILNKPMVVVYKTSYLTYTMAKLLIKISYIGLVNIVAGEKIVPECIQQDATPKKIAQELDKILVSDKMWWIKSKLTLVKYTLGEPGASTRAAKSVLNVLGR